MQPLIRVHSVVLSKLHNKTCKDFQGNWVWDRPYTQLFGGQKDVNLCEVMLKGLRLLICFEG